MCHLLQVLKGIQPSGPPQGGRCSWAVSFIAALRSPLSCSWLRLYGVPNHMHSETVCTCFRMRSNILLVCG
jgi:hypothetical protein